jgi:hypothetical protein
MAKTLDAEQVIQKIADTLAMFSGEGIAEVARDVGAFHNADVKYIGDSLFEVTKLYETEYPEPWEEDDVDDDT